MQSFSKQKQVLVQVQPGYRDALMGDLDGWTGRVIRQFSVDSIVYYDVEIGVMCLEYIPIERKRQFIADSICFTRIRVPAQKTTEIELEDPPIERAKQFHTLQVQWYGAVGNAYTDLTRDRSDREYSMLSDPARRQFMMVMGGLGVAAIGLIVGLSQCAEEGGSSSSWGRVGGGGYYG